jgi:hypothetical protein
MARGLHYSQSRRAERDGRKSTTDPLTPAPTDPIVRRQMARPSNRITSTLYLPIAAARARLLGRDEVTFGRQDGADQPLSYDDLTRDNVPRTR